MINEMMKIQQDVEMYQSSLKKKEDVIKMLGAILRLPRMCHSYQSAIRRREDAKLIKQHEKESI